MLPQFPRPHKIAFLIAALICLILPFASPTLAEPQVGSTVYFPIILKNYAGAGSGFGRVSGIVSDIRTGGPVEGIIVCLEGTTNCDTSATDGKYLLEQIPSGSRRFVATDPSNRYLRSEETAEVFSNLTNTRDFSLFPALQQNQLRVIITWDTHPKWPPSDVPNDFNLHLWYSQDGYPPYTHVYEGATGFCSDLEIYPYACYERDAQGGGGPDVIVFKDLGQIYYIAVLNYYEGWPGVPPINDLATRGVPAQVQAYKGASLIFQYQLSTENTLGAGDLWYVFKIDTAQVLLQDCLTQYVEPGTAPPPDYCLTLRGIR